MKRKDPRQKKPSERTSFVEIFAKSQGLKVWELYLLDAMEDLQRAMACKDVFSSLWQCEYFHVEEEEIEKISPADTAAFWKDKQKELADKVGQLIAAELVKRNYQVLRIAAEGWDNLNSDKPFKNRSGKPINQWILFSAHWELTICQKIDHPSMDEVIAHLAARNPPVKMSKGRLSKLVDELQMEGWLRDERLAKNRYKKAKG